MSSEKYRQEMVKLLRMQQSYPDKSATLRQQNWREYVNTREAYFMEVAREQGMTYSPPKEAISGAESHMLERQTGRQGKKILQSPQS